MTTYNHNSLYFYKISTLLICLASVIFVAQELPEKLQKLSKDEALKLAKRCDQNVLSFCQKGQLDKALELAQVSLKLREKHLPPHHLDITASLNILASLLQAKGDYTEAESLYYRALEINEKVRGKNHPEVATSLNHLALLLQAKGDYAEAEPLYRRALQIYEKVLDKEHPDLATNLNSLASLLYAKGDYVEAESLYRRALLIYEKVRGKEHPEIAIILNHLALLLQAKGDYAEAEPLYYRALEINEKMRGKEHPDLTQSLNNLALLLQAKGNDEDAEPLFRRALEINEKAFGNDHFEVATSLNNLAGLFQAKGNYEGAEPLYRRALEINEKVLGKEHPSVANNLNNLALLLQAKGDNQDAEPLFRRALEINEKVLKKEHPDLATSLNNLALLLQAKGNDEDAKALFRRALEINEKVLGKEHPDLATNLDNLALLFYNNGDYEGAEAFFRRALQIREKVLGSEHPDFATSLNNLAGLLQAKGDYKGSETLFRRTLEVYEKVLGHEHPNFATNLDNLGAFLTQQNRNEEGKEYFSRSFNIRAKNINLMFPILTERQQEGYLNSYFRVPLNTYLSVFTQPSEQNNIYQNLFLYRGISSRTLRNRTRAIADPNVAVLFVQLKEARAYYAKLYLSPDPKFSPKVQQKLLKEAVERKETLERQLSAVSKEFLDNDILSKETLSDIQNLLDAQTVIVDFLFYSHTTDWKYRLKEERLIAFVITNKALVQRVDLGVASPLRSAIKAFRQQLQTGRTILFEDIPVDEYLTQQLWKPLEAHLSEKQLVYLIPDGELAFIPFEALPIEQNGERHYLSELKSIAYLSSPQDFIEFTLENEINARSLLCLGDVAYSEFPEASTSLDKEALRTESSTENEVWSALPGTADECTFLMNAFQTSFPNESHDYLSQKKASKALLQEKAVGKRYVHLATHGFFKTLPESPHPQKKGGLRGGLSLVWSEDDEPTQRRSIPEGVNPMLYSGIVLAGANLKKGEGSGKEELLTAEELAGMDLRGTELLTLSACETALGEGLSGQGVSGLRLAAQVAGARSMLLSLWKVDDLGTQLFMQRFYSKLWNENKGRLKALQETRLEWIVAQRQRKRGPNGEDIYSPKVWASFILSGQP